MPHPPRGGRSRLEPLQRSDKLTKSRRPDCWERRLKSFLSWNRKRDPVRGLPGVTDTSGAGVGVRTVAPLAVGLYHEGETARQPPFDARRGQQEILRRRGTEHEEVRSGPQRGEAGGRRG